MHARSGGNIEVMGLMQGKVHGDTMIIMDAFGLPVEGTETRVNAQNEAYEYMVSYMEQAKEVREGGRRIGHIMQEHSLMGFGLLGWSFGKCDWMVSFSSWIWLLALGYRCEYTNAQSAIPRTMGRCGGKCECARYNKRFDLSHVMLHRSIPTGPCLQAKWILARFEPIPK